MNYFNITGFHTKLPITKGDDVFVLLCIYNPTYMLTLEYLSPYLLFTPIVLPIFGKYDGAGCINNITYDTNVKHIEDITGCDIDTLLQDIFDVNANRYNANDNIVNLIIDSIKVPTTYCKLVYIMDHRCFYDACKDMYAVYKKYLSTCLENTIKHQCNISRYKQGLQLLANRLHDESIMNIDYIANIQSLSPNIGSGKYFGMNEYNSNIFLSLYKDEFANILLANYEPYFDFLCFLECFFENSWMFEMHHIGKPDCEYKNYLAIYEDMASFIKSKIKN